MTVNDVLDHLAAAFGGHSQYGFDDIGRAIAGQMNNQGWSADPDTYAREVADVLAERWGDDRWEQDREAVDSAIRGALFSLAERQSPPYGKTGYRMEASR